MKFNGATFNKAQQDQLKKKVGAELELLAEKLAESSQNSLRYLGNWKNNKQYHPNDVVINNYACYVCKIDNKNQKPSSTSNAWTCIGCYGSKRSELDVPGYTVKSFFNYIESLKANQFNIGDITISAQIEGVYVPLVYSTAENIKHIAYGFVISESSGAYNVVEYMITCDVYTNAVTAIKRTNGNVTAITPPTDWKVNLAKFNL